MIDLEAIKKRLEGVGDDVWKTRECEDYYQGGTYICVSPEAGYGNEGDICRVEPHGSEDFLLNAPSDIRALLDRVEQLEKVFLATVAFRDAWREDHSHIPPKTQTRDMAPLLIRIWNEVADCERVIAHQEKP